jgi:hypothetical protein
LIWYNWYTTISELKEKERQEQIKFARLSSEAGYEIRSLIVKSIKMAASRMDLKITDIYYNEAGHFHIGRLEGFKDESQIGIENAVDELFKNASDEFFGRLLKDLIERNPKYFGLNLSMDDNLPNPMNDNAFNRSFKKYFLNKHIEFSSYIKRKSFSQRERHQIFARDNYTCQMCGFHSPYGDFLEVDHIYPIRYGGSNRPENLQTLGETCNRSKGAKLIET